MHSPVESLSTPPYGLSFSIDQLVLVRQWAESRGLRMIVALDQVAENAEYEEMLVLAAPNRNRRTLTMWRTFGSIFVQVPNGRPRAFATMEDALGSLRPAAVKRGLLRRLLGSRAH